MKSREVAYLALLSSMKQEHFLTHVLERWRGKEHPLPQDFSFAYEIAAGSARMALSLDYMATQLSAKGKLSLKLKERALLRMALYQYYFMDRVPIYAIVDETIDLAKKYCHPIFTSYLNALLRQLEEGIPQLPKGNSIEDLSIRYSYPASFIAELTSDYNQETAIKILELGNQPSLTIVRVRPGIFHNVFERESLGLIQLKDTSFAVLKKSENLSKIVKLPHYYIQNPTPAILIEDLAHKIMSPRTVLDLCAAPGGKLLATHDLFPEAKLFANDVSLHKVERIKQNFAKYQIEIDIRCGLGQEYMSEFLFDLIILDVPCSNSGVLNKRPEARWRLTEEALDTLRQKQESLIVHALSLLSPEGSLWYLTCSILKRENEKLIENICRRFPLKILYSRTILPNSEGWDGGFACLLQKN